MMVHPTYTYGKDGYVFFQMSYENPDPVFCGPVLRLSAAGTGLLRRKRSSLYLLPESF